MVHRRRPRKSIVLTFHWVSTTRWVIGLHFKVTVDEKYLSVSTTITFRGTWCFKMGARGLVPVTADSWLSLRSMCYGTQHHRAPRSWRQCFNFSLLSSGPLWLHLHVPKRTQLAWNMTDFCMCYKHLPALCQGLGNWTRLPVSCLLVSLIILMAFSWDFCLGLPLLALTGIFVLSL